MEITYLKGVGPKRAELYKKLGVETAEQLVEFYPRDYIDLTSPKKIGELEDGDVCAFRAFVTQKTEPSGIYGAKKVIIYKAVLSDGNDTASASFFNTKYAFDALNLNGEYLFYGKITKDFYGVQISSPFYVKPENAGLIPKYRLTAGLSGNTVSANVRTALETVKIEERFPESLIKENNLAEKTEAVKNIHFPKNKEDYLAAKRRLVFEELLTLRLGLAMLKKRGRGHSGALCREVDMSELWDSLPFSPTNAQLRAVSDCIGDMKKNCPMNRLVQGDVGSGKTLIAAAAAYFCAKNGFQTLVMAPTEVLAKQHYETFSGFLAPLGINIALISGSLSQKQKNDARKMAASGHADIIVGTQALIQKSYEVKKAGLVIVDEQHRFGVGQRSALADKGLNPHIMAMSATPIPRTLALIMYSDLDVSVIDEAPKGRIPVKTYAVDTSFRQRVYRFIRKFINAGRQAYIVCPLVGDSQSPSNEKASAVRYFENLSSGEFSDIPIGLLYGKMKQKDKDEVMSMFKDNKIKLLISTTVIEVGIDVPNAVVMLIENFEQFGLSQLHQLRGRVGRGNEQSYCILMSDSKSDYSRARAAIMKKTSDGFEIAREDLRLRGPGNFFGKQQHGLPPLKISDLADDEKILGEVEKAAESILEKDKNLSAPENSGLKKNVAELFGINGANVRN